MVSDAMGAKVLGKRSEGTLSAVYPIRRVENKAKICFTSRWILDVFGVEILLQKYTTRHTNESTTKRRSD